MTLRGSKRFTIGSVSVIIHGVKTQGSPRWVSTVVRGQSYVYRVEVTDIMRTATSASVNVSSLGIQRLMFNPSKLPIQRFQVPTEGVDAAISYAQGAVGGDQDIDVDVTVNYPSSPCTKGHRNRIHVM